MAETPDLNQEIQEVMEAAAKPLLDKRNQLLQQKAELVNQLQWVNQGLRQVDKFLFTVGVLERPAQNKPGPKPAQSSSTREFEEKYDRIVPIIASERGEWWTSKVRERFGVTGSTAASILDRMRREELIRLAGTRSGRGGEHRVYRLHDDVELVNGDNA